MLVWNPRAQEPKPEDCEFEGSLGLAATQQQEVYQKGTLPYLSSGHLNLTPMWYNQEDS